MHSRPILKSFLALGSSLLLSSCNESLTGTRASQSVPVSFRMVGTGAESLQVTDLVQIRSWAGDSAHRQRLDSLVQRWQDKEVALRVPLDQPLEFRFDGLNRRNGRLVAFWNALGFDTLHGGDRTGDVTALKFTPRSDTAGPSSAVLTAPSGSQLLLKGDSLLVSLPTGTGSGTLALPASLDSVYLGGTALAKDASGGWSFPATRGQDLSLTVVNPNGTSSSWILGIRSGDIVGPAFTYALTNLRSEPKEDGDTVRLVLPYVLDSALTLTLASADPKDVPTSLRLGQNLLDVTGSPWTLSVKAPVAGDPAGVQYPLVAKDSLGNVTSKVLKVTRPHYAGTPALAWDPPITGRLWGAQKDTLFLKATGGDSALTPSVTLKGFTDVALVPEPLWRRADTSLWRCVVSLQEKDSGTVEASATNASGKSAHLDTLRISRYDPLTGLPPTLAAPLPADGFWTNLAYVDLSGKAWDGKGGTATVVISDGNGWSDSATTTPSDSTWTRRIALPADGSRSLTVTAHDRNGRPAERSYRRLIQRDTRPPSMEWSGMSLHGDTLWTRDERLALQALFKDTAGGKVCSLVVRRIGTPIRTLGSPFGTAGLWRDTLDVRGLQGVSEWTATGYDSAGNANEQVFHVLRNTVKPAISVTTPTSTGIGKYAFSASKDTLWISGDTSLTISVSAQSGSASIPLSPLGVDSNGTTKTYSTFPLSLTIRQGASTQSLRSIAIKDSLGNLSDTLRLAVIGLAPIAAPTVKFGNSSSAAGHIDSLPWPKTAHMTCPTGTALNIGTGTAKDSAIWTTTNLSISCNGPKIRSDLMGYKWTIRDTAYAPSGFQTPSYPARIALVLDIYNQPWISVCNGSVLSYYRFSTDSAKWVQASSTDQIWMPDTISAANGRSSTGAKFFNLTTSLPYSTWSSPTDTRAPSVGILSRQAAIHGDSVYVPKLSPVNGELWALAIPFGYSSTIDTFKASSNQGDLGPINATRSFVLEPVLRRNNPWQIARIVNGSFDLSSGKYLPTDMTLPALATRSKDDSLVVIGTSKSQSTLWIQKYSSFGSSSAILENSSASPLSSVATLPYAAWEGNDLWINSPSNAVFRITSDLADIHRWSITGALGTPGVNAWDGAWTLVYSGGGYQVLHLKGSKQ